jgi:hypothetical protein
MSSQNAASTALWLLEQLPTLEEIKPCAQLLDLGARHKIPSLYSSTMQLIPGHLSFCKTLGTALNGPGSREAWSRLSELSKDDLQSLAASACNTLVSAIVPTAHEEAASTFVWFLFVEEEGRALLQAVAKELGARSVYECHAWDAHGEVDMPPLGAKFNAAWIVKRVLLFVARHMVDSFDLPDFYNHKPGDSSGSTTGDRDCTLFATDCCLYAYEPDSARPERWHFVVPCMHWICGGCYACGPDVFGANLRCPTCRGAVEHTRLVTKGTASAGAGEPASPARRKPTDSESKTPTPRVRK